MKIVEKPWDVIRAVQENIAVAVYYQDFKAPHSDFHYIVFERSVDWDDWRLKRFRELLPEVVLSREPRRLNQEVLDEIRSIIGHECTPLDTNPVYLDGRWCKDPAKLVEVNNPEERKLLYRSLEIYSDEEMAQLSKL